MTIGELINTSALPLTPEQRKELNEDHVRLLSSIKELGESLEKANAEVFRAKKDAEDEEKRKCKAINDGVGCLLAVRAMLLNSMGSVHTHRQRDFYADAMVKYIDSTIARMEVEKESYPF